MISVIMAVRSGAESHGATSARVGFVRNNCKHSSNRKLGLFKGMPGAPVRRRLALFGMSLRGISTPGIKAAT